VSRSPRPLFGVETEYALVATDARGHSVGPLAATDLLELAAELPTLPHREGGLVLENGGRLYLDHGSHPELATPECTDPADVVRYVAAGEELLAELAGRLEAGRSTVARARVFRTNVDYDLGATWGCHESYLHRVQWSAFAPHLVPHLVTRVLFSGAGGFEPRHPGISFTLSPRSRFIERVVSENSVAERGILHSKEESLASAPYGRLHVVFGESLCSHTALWLKVGTTALVVAMIEAGRRSPVSRWVRDPVAAARAVARDPECRQTMRLESGRETTALEVQLRLLAEAERFVGVGGAPEWGEAVCRRWRAVLEALADDPASLATSLDWSLKRAIFGDRLRRRGLTWSDLERWNGILVRLAELAAREGGRPVPANRPSWWLPAEPERQALVSRLDLEGGSRDELEEVIELRSELFEIDMRFGELGGGGLFDALDRRRLLRHRLTGPGSIRAARREPPSTTRARVRGRVVRERTGQPGIECDWTTAWDTAAGLWIDLSDPFTGCGDWQPRPEPEAAGGPDLDWAALAVDGGVVE